MSLPTQTREIVLASRPNGAPTPDNFRLVERDLPALQDGEILVRNTVMSVDPYMRGRMNDVKSYVPPFQIDQPLDGGAVGTVIASRAEGFAEGDSVLHGLGWRDVAVLPGARASKVDTADFSDSAYLGVLGMPGLTAYAGLMAAAEFKAGDAVFVSGAAGAVGSLVGQIARLSGASRVVGSAGSAEKVARLKDLGFDAAFNYRDGAVRDLLKQAAPEGIDVYFDNVGADHLEAAISSMKLDGRIAMCGAIAQYNATEPACAPRNLTLLIGKRITMRGFIVSKYNDLQQEFRQTVGPWLADGSITWDETVREGLDNAPQAFIDLLAGANTGKMIVRLD
ncbi:NADP-dependent oxidoreductase [Yimella sp. cx-51]|uniref:NADP-dependent oxidoreductase n=1 Tax=Yimella sp. cx-51 TaxID=2770551 RepID=UPI00165DE69F|nr:NADP-dependent oxidoreductase [Yimella sp. cx-51]MBC9958310.1 NADP-dependent oxidoreductase [Yimella sp. cx-51]QTH38243.1 NADP-dependent oxidoreductase [Yimella sp. cx-51]